MEKENDLKVVYCVIDKSNYYQEPVTIRIFYTKEIAIKFCDDHKDRGYEWFLLGGNGSWVDFNDMTYQEAKDKAAKILTNNEYESFDLMLNHAGGGIIGVHVLLAAMEQAAELYAKSKWEESTDSNRQETERVFDKAGGTLSANYFFRNVKRPEFK